MISTSRAEFTLRSVRILVFSVALSIAVLLTAKGPIMFFTSSNTCSLVICSLLGVYPSLLLYEIHCTKYHACVDIPKSKAGLCQDFCRTLLRFLDDPVPERFQIGVQVFTVY